MPLIKDLAAEVAHVEALIVAEQKRLKGNTVSIDRARGIQNQDAVELLEVERLGLEAAIAELGERLSVLNDPLSSELELDTASAVRSIATLAHVAVGDMLEGWADVAIDEVRDAAVRRLDGTDEALALVGVAALRKVAPVIGRRGAWAVSSALTKMAAGDVTGAELVWLATTATFDERRKAMRDATIFAIAEADQVAADWEQFKAAMLEAGEFALTKVLPFVLAALA